MAPVYIDEENKVKIMELYNFDGSDVAAPGGSIDGKDWQVTPSFVLI